MRALVVLACAAGCIRGSNGFHCETAEQCAGAGAGATCEATGFCSVADSSCASGSRYGSLSGPLAGQCVGAPDAGIDTPVDMAPPIDSPPGDPDFVVEAHAFGGQVDNLHYILQVPGGVMNPYLIVVVSIPSDCSATSVTAQISSISYDGVALAPVKTLLGTACQSGSTRMEQWGVVAPQAGQHEVVVQLDRAAQYTVHSGALVFKNVNQTTPVRSTAALGGVGTQSSLDVASMPNDLVVNTVGHGGGIASTAQTIRYVQNVNSGNSLNNSAASTAVATAAITSMSWTFVDNDEWQTISATLRP
jgi:hypothetical protein